MNIEEILSVLSRKRFHFNDEKALQKDIQSILSIELPHIHFQREYYLDKENIIDFWVDSSLGIEVKIKGGKRALYQQCVRYCKFDQIKQLLLITNLSIGFPEQINGKDCYVLKLGTAWL